MAKRLGIAGAFGPAILGKGWLQFMRCDHAGAKKKPCLNKTGLQRIWQLPTLPHCGAVPSAMRGLTSLFGMGRGEHPRQNHHKIFNIMTYREL